MEPDTKEESDFRDFNDELPDDDDDFLDKNYGNEAEEDDETDIEERGRSYGKSYRSEEELDSRKTSARSSRESSMGPDQPRKRGRPKKLLTASAVKIKKRRGRPRKGYENPLAGVSRFGAVDASEEIRRRRKLTPEYGPPIPLTKHRQLQTQKPLYIDMERLKSGSNKRQKLNTLDVLKFLVKDFEPIPSTNDSIKPKLIQKDMKTHILDHLGHLSDVHGSIDDLNFEISKIQKEKELTRTKILELRKDHNDLGNKLNSLREDYQQSKENHEKFIQLTDNIDELRSIVKGDKPINNDIIKSVDSKLNHLSKIFNPIDGVNAKIHELNRTLTRINNDI
ncbi:hypothetical protein CLIB1444_02S01200 [[Candida] jaroonii]|uniref:Uncharacterized protein n=1 Tax=[Candida] jaroonii TaxID=467808 RepID=A0ACA9Y2H9_9ASCO|nr:hypothetical protein CLIB1444_02S01200 [[Candida] jaroonii]